MPRFATLSLAALLAATSGCAGLSVGSLNPFAKVPAVADAKNPAVEVACIWQPGEGRNGQGIPARGFAGQIFFFTNRDPEPVLVDGDVRIYLFADRGTAEERAMPLHQYDFTPEAWATHATMTSLGPGYTVFVPYPKTEPYQVRCQLRARFTPRTGGPPIWSEAVTMVLEGPPQPGAEPAWWANADRSPSPPTVAEFEVSHRSGTLAQLRGGDPTDAAAPRKLRTDTFQLGEVRQISYETPAKVSIGAALPQRPAARTGREAFADRKTRPSQPPEPGARDVHPLQASTAAAAGHPLERASRPVTSPSIAVEPDAPRFRLGGQSAAGEPRSAGPVPQDYTPVGRAHPLGEDAAPAEIGPPMDGGVWHPLAE